MGATTKIEWADKTFNPWIGCQKVSPACDGCYAEAMMDLRYGRVRWGGPGKGIGTRARTSAANWRQPLAWNRAAAKAGTRPFVFCASLADVFDNAVPAQWRRDLFGLIRATPHLVWLLLTKRPGNILRLYGEAILDPPDGGFGYPWPENAAIGCTVVTQAEANRDIPVLLRAKGDLHPAFAFVSMEPLLGSVEIIEYLPNKLWNDIPSWKQPELDWIIAGGESGSHARPMHPDWARRLRDQCTAAGVPFFFKQWGEWLDERIATARNLAPGPRMFDAEGEPTGGRWHFYNGEDIIGGAAIRVGKARAGRLLDGRTWDERPPMPALASQAALANDLPLSRNTP